MKSTFQAFLEAFLRLSLKFKNIVIVDAASNAFSKHNSFITQIPNRYYSMGHAYADTAGVAAGMALAGKIPFVFGPAECFIPETYNVVKTHYCLSNTTTHLVMVDNDISQPKSESNMTNLLDFLVLSGLPNIKLFYPADYTETYSLFSCLPTTYGPTYTRLSQKPTPLIKYENQAFIMNTPGESRDVGIFAFGQCLHYALEIAQLLNQHNISISLMNVSTLQPLDTGRIVKIAQTCRNLFVLENAEDSLDLLSTLLASTFLECSLGKYGKITVNPLIDNPAETCKQILASMPAQVYKVAQ